MKVNQLLGGVLVGLAAVLLVAGSGQARQIKGRTVCSGRRLVATAVATDGSAVSTQVRVKRHKSVELPDGSTGTLYIGTFSLDVPEGQKVTILFQKRARSGKMKPKTAVKFATDASGTAYTTQFNVSAPLPGAEAAIDLGRIKVRRKLTKPKLNPLEAVDNDGDGQSDFADPDDDDDAVADSQDEDADGDGILDADQDQDTDDDGRPDMVDCDDDGDGVKDKEDLDADGDGLADWDGDMDHDGDTIVDGLDPDDDNDGIADDQDGDIDGDGVMDAIEQDSDGDGVPDDCDEDDDNDGIADSLDEDNDGDGILDADEQDLDGDGVPDDCDNDDDGDGVPDWKDSDIQVLLDGNRIVFALAGQAWNFTV